MYINADSYHTYSLFSEGLKKTYSEVFLTRDEANQFMYRLVRKYKLKMKEVWDDKHDKTYCYENGVKFYIQRI